MQTLHNRWLIVALTLVAIGVWAASAVRAAGDATVGAGDLVAQEAQGVRIKRLDNGLVVITKENHAAPVASVYVMVRAGGILEGEYLGAGISHLTEHLVSGGTTTTRSEDEIQKAISDIGAMTNAYTSSDRTVYFIRTVPEHIDTAIDLLSDNIMNAAIPQAEFDREFEVVQREILTGESEPDRQLYYLQSELMFPDMPQGMRTIGYYKNIQKLTRDDVVKYYKSRYVPSNAVVVVAGDVDGATMLARIEKAFASWDGPHVQPVVLPEPVPPVADLVGVKEIDTKLAQVMVCYHSCRLSDPDLYPLDVLASILGDGDSSRLAADLKTKRNLVYGISASNYTPQWPGGEFVVSFTCDDDKVDAVREAVAEHLAAVCSAPPSEEELRKVKTQVVANHLMQNRTADAQASSLASDQLHLGDPFFSARYVQNIQSVTADQVQRVARKYLEGTRSITAIVRPKQAGDETQARAAASLKPTTIRKVLPVSGLTLLIYRTPGQPAVSMIAAMKAGQSFETDEDAGMSAMIAQYLTRGTTTRSEQQIAEFYDGIGGRIDADSGWSSVYVESIVLKSDFEKALDVFADVVLNPAFSADLLESTRQRQLAGLRSTQSDPVGECMLYFGQEFYTDSPYRFPQMGSEESIARLSVETLKAFYEKARCGKNMVLAVAGDVDPAAVEELVAKAFASLNAGEPLKPSQSVARREAPDTEVHVRQTDKAGTVIMVGYGGPDMYETDDRIVMDVFDTVSSGYYMPRGWLHGTLRGQSLVYVVHFFGRAGLLPGSYQAYALCQPDNATKVARLMEDLLYSGRDYEYTEDDLRQAKSTILSSRQMRRQLPEQVALMMTLDELYGLGYDFEEEYAERLQAVTADDVRRVVNKYIDKAVICITTPKPDAVDVEMLRKPYDAELLKAMRGTVPAELPVRREHMPPQ
ncbi:MAG: insulinase family protein [Planctomycetes bacterium]|nr:insulinase family protein [Planctomycetota bacterium]